MSLNQQYEKRLHALVLEMCMLTKACNLLVLLLGRAARRKGIGLLLSRLPRNNVNTLFELVEQTLEL